jgi:hypothetical protein
VTLQPGTTRTYKVSSGQYQLFQRNWPFYHARAGRNLLRDISGPGSFIGDSSVWSYCVALVAGECRPDSTPGSFYEVIPKLTTTATTCWSNQYSNNVACADAGSAQGAWILQYDASRNDSQGTLFRRITMGFSGPGRQYEFSNARSMPDGSGMIFPANWVDGVRNELLFAKLPHWPVPADVSTERTTFVNRGISISGSGDSPKVRIRFGYFENGPADSFYCSSRQDACTTDAAIAPFAYESEQLTLQDCSQNCVIPVPALPGRVLFYQVLRFDTNGVMKYQGPIQALATP